MAQLLTGPFNALQYDPELGAAQLPLGMKQPMRIISEEVVAAKSNGNNGFIAFTVEILDGPNKGAQGVHRLNVYHSDDKTVEFAMRGLSALSIACGKPHWQDSRELFNLPFLADVTPQKETEQNKDKGYTQISQVYDVNGNKPKRGGATGGGNQQQQTQVNTNQQQQQSSNSGDWNQGNNQQAQQTNGNGQGGNAGWNQNQGNDQQQQPQQQTNNGGNADWQQNQNNQSNNNGGGQAQSGNSTTPPWMQNKG